LQLNVNNWDSENLRQTFYCLMMGFEITMEVD